MSFSMLIIILNGVYLLSIAVAAFALLDCRVGKAARNGYTYRLQDQPRKLVLLSVFWLPIIVGIALYVIFWFAPKMFYRAIVHNSFKKKEKLK